MKYKVISCDQCIKRIGVVLKGGCVIPWIFCSTECAKKHEEAEDTGPIEEEPDQSIWDRNEGYQGDA